MEFEYNANLEFSERVKMVAQEIQKAYPKISHEEAAFAAAHATPIDDKVTNDDKFDRYYFILKTISKNNREFKNVLNDAYMLYEDGLNDNKYKNIMPEIIKYSISNTKVFPELIDYQ